MPEWCSVVRLAVALHQLPDDVASMSELWFWRTLIYLEEEQHNQRKDEDKEPPPLPEPKELDADGNWILGLGEGEETDNAGS